MDQFTFIFDAGIRNNVHTFTCGGLSLDLTNEDYLSFEQNKLDDVSIKVMAYSFLTKQLFQDFSIDTSRNYYELRYKDNS